MRNRVITDAFEPGSALKPLAVLTAMEFGEVGAEDVVDTNPGWMRLGGSLVKDSRNYGQYIARFYINHHCRGRTGLIVNHGFFNFFVR